MASRTYSNYRTQSCCSCSVTPASVPTAVREAIVSAVKKVALAEAEESLHSARASAYAAHVTPKNAMLHPACKRRVRHPQLIYFQSIETASSRPPRVELCLNSPTTMSRWHGCRDMRPATRLHPMGAGLVISTTADVRWLLFFGLQGVCRSLAAHLR